MKMPGTVFFVSGLLLTSACVSRSPYVQQIWEAGAFEQRYASGVKGGSTQYEQIVLFDNGDAVWTTSFQGLMPRAPVTRRLSWSMKEGSPYLNDGDRETCVTNLTATTVSRTSGFVTTNYIQVIRR